MGKPAKFIPEDILEKLYVIERKDMREVAGLLNVSFATVQKYIHFYNIAVRTKEDIYGTGKLTKDVLQDLYIIQGKSIRQIAEKFGLTKPTVLKYMKSFEIPRRVAGYNSSGICPKPIKIKQIRPKKERIKKLNNDEAAMAIMAVIGW